MTDITRAVYGRQIRKGDVLPKIGPRFVVHAFEPLDSPLGDGRVAIDLMGRRVSIFDAGIWLLPVERS